MATTNDFSRYQSLDNARRFKTQVAQDRHVQPKVKGWGRVKEWMLEIVYGNPWVSCCFCTDKDTYDDMLMQRETDAAVRHCLMLSYEHASVVDVAHNPVELVMEDMYEQGYNMYNTTRGPNKQIAPPPGPAPALPEDLAPARHPIEVRRAQRIPAFVAAVVIALRQKLGTQPASVPGNKLVVEREALKLMREYNVRAIDICTHMPAIMHNYFYADVHHRAYTHRSRMPRFMRWAAGYTPAPDLGPSL